MVDDNTAVERNLKIYLKSTGANCDGQSSVSTMTLSGVLQLLSSFDSQDGIKIVKLERRQILLFFLLRVVCTLKRIKSRTVYNIRDGVMACFFDSKSSSIYQKYRTRHTLVGGTKKERFKQALPCFIRTRAYYVVLNSTKSNILEEKIEIMFFSNPEGKLLFLDNGALASGIGTIMKTSSTPEYTEVIEKEYSLMESLGQSLGSLDILPQISKRQNIEGRPYFIEEYLSGNLLMSALASKSVCMESAEYQRYFSQLDQWFSSYTSIFKEDSKPFSELFAWVFPIYREAYGAEGLKEDILCEIESWLFRYDNTYPWPTPVVSHCDLWPGNFIVTSRGLIAIDWERAASGRAEFFDYFWMIVSTGLELEVGRYDLGGYDTAFEKLTDSEDEVGTHVTGLLRGFLASRGIEPDEMNRFFILFLLELSVQGYFTLRYSTSMDRLVNKQLLKHVSMFDMAAGSRTVRVAADV